MSRLVKLACRPDPAPRSCRPLRAPAPARTGELLAPPPISRLALRPHVREPVLINYRAHFSRRRASKRIARKQRQHVRLIFQQALLRPNHETRSLPRSQRRKPQIPFKPRLIRRINSRRLINRLRLVAKRIRDPSFSIAACPEIRSHSARASLPQIIHKNWRCETAPAPALAPPAAATQA